MQSEPLTLHQLDATAQAELVRRGEVSPLELVDAAIARIERLDPEINAVPIRLFREARAAARSVDLPSGPFRGVPFLLKDAGTSLAGQPYYMGNSWSRRWVAKTCCSRWPGNWNRFARGTTATGAGLPLR